ncbi:hypothetical protein D3C73_1023730 [compost metagenome]
MRLHTINNVQISRWPSAKSSFSFARNTLLRAIIDTRRNLKVNFTLLLYLAAAAAGWTFLLDNLSFTTAIAACATVNHATERRILNNLLLA